MKNTDEVLIANSKGNLRQIKIKTFNINGLPWKYSRMIKLSNLEFYDFFFFGFKAEKKQYQYFVSVMFLLPFIKKNVRFAFIFLNN